MKNVMIDIETMGNTSNAAIVSIAAIAFDINTGKTGNQFYTTVTLQSCLDTGLHCDASTIQWWMEQNEHARKKLFDTRSMDIADALESLYKWINENDLLYPWGNSARFDLGLLTDAYQKINHALPWKFYNERCYRTISSLFPEVKALIPKPENAHDPIVDCEYQIKVLVKLWNRINGQLSL